MTAPKNYLIDMDGVLVKGRTVIPQAPGFIERLRDRDAKFLVLTNNPLYTPGDLSHRLKTIGLEIPASNIFTSAMATARFLKSQKERGTAFVIGESGLTSPLHEIGFIITDQDTDYVVLGETTTYNFEMITKAIRLVGEGATELVHVAQMALIHRSNVDVCIENIFNYPTLHEAYRVAALDVVRKREALAAGV